VVRCSCPQDRAAPASPPHRQAVRKPVRSRWGATNVTRSIHRPARPPRLWQASSATEPVASVHHRDCRDRRLRSRRTSPALTCRDRLLAVGPSVTGWRRLQLGELCDICVARSGIAAETGNGKCRFAGAFRGGSDGTRTRSRTVRRLERRRLRQRDGRSLGRDLQDRARRRPPLPRLRARRARDPALDRLLQRRAATRRARRLCRPPDTRG
jgi:hypothetical protein